MARADWRGRGAPRYPPAMPAKSANETAPPKPQPPRRLGRGLSSLMGEPADGSSGERERPTPSQADAAKPADQHTPAEGPVLLTLPVDKIDFNPHQPRKEIDRGRLSELAASVARSGVIQPVVVRASGGRYELIAGERRLRAAREAGLTTIPAVTREADAAEQAEIALVENVQRDDLNAIDRAEAYRDLQRLSGLSVSDLARRTGEDRTRVSHYLRLNELADPVKELVRGGRVSLGHAKVLAGVRDPSEQSRLAALVESRGITVRALERLAADTGREKRPKPANLEGEERRRYLDQLSGTLTRSLGSQCTVRGASDGGYELTVRLRSAEQFDSLMGRLNLPAAGA